MSWWKIIILILALALLGLLVYYNFIYEASPEPYQLAALLSVDIRDHKLAGFIDNLANYGLIEDVHYQLEIANANGSLDLMDKLAYNLVQSRPDLLIAFGGVEADALKSALAQTRLDIPIVLAGVASSIERDLIEGYQSHASQITGVDNYHTELASKRLELLVKIIEDLDRVLIVYDPNVVPAEHSMGFVEETASLLGITIHKFAVEAETCFDQELPPIFVEKNIQAITYLPSFLIEERLDQLLAIANHHQVGLMGVNDYEVEQGALASYGVSYYNQGAQAAPIVYKILSGQKANQIPVELPDQIDLTINMKVAKDFGLEISDLGIGFAAKIIH